MSSKIKEYKHLWNLATGEGSSLVFGVEETNAFWDLDIEKVKELLAKSELSINECYYPYEEKFLDIFYFSFAKYIVKYEKFDVQKVVDYLYFLIENGWNFSKHKSKILNIIHMLKFVRKDDESIKEIINHDLFNDKEDN